LDLHESGIIFIFDLEYLIRVQSSEPLHAKKNPTSCLLGSWFACAQTIIFSAEQCSKKCERHQLFFGLQLVSKEFQHPAIQTKIKQQFGEFFHQIKVCQPIGRQDSMQTVIRKSRRLDSFCMKRLRTFQIFKSEIKK
jgi:hypothetical protein